MGYIAVLILFVMIIILGVHGAIKTSKAQKQAKHEIENDVRFNNSKEFTVGISGKIYISETGYICISIGKNKIIHINDLNGYDIVKNGKSSGGLGTAVAGGLLFGGVGVVTGAILGKNKKEIISNLSLVLKTNDFNEPTISIPFIITKTKSSSIVAKTAEKTISEILAILEILEKKYKTA